MMDGSATGVFLDAAAADEWHSPARRTYEGIPSFAASDATGRMWATWYASPTGAENADNYLVLATSADGGATWPFALPLDVGRSGVSYPDGQQLADGRIAVVYDFDRFGARRILLAFFREEDVRAGRFQTPGAPARRTIR